MEVIEHRRVSRRKRNSARVNLTISVVFHVVVFAVGAFWAAREGMMGKGMQNLTVVLVPKQKKADEPKKDEPKAAEAKAQPTVPRPNAARSADLPRPAVAPPPAFVDVAAPPPADVPVLTLGDLGAGEGGGDAISNYKDHLENSLRSVWARPENVSDVNFVAEVEVMVSAAGRIEGHELKQSSGDRRWDDSVLKAVTAARSLGRAPPTGFPERFRVRFDVLPATEPLL